MNMKMKMKMSTVFLVSVLLLMILQNATHTYPLDIVNCTCNENTFLQITCECTVGKNCLNHRELSIEHVFSAIEGIHEKEFIYLINKLVLHDIPCPIITQASNIFNKDSLTQLTFTSANLKSIDKELFNNSRLKEVSILDNIVPLELEEDTFELIPQLELLEIRNSPIYQFNNVFYNLRKLKIVEFPYNQIREINSNTFQTNLGLTYINMSNNMLNEIKTNTFAGLTNLTTVDLNNNHLRTIGKGSFQNLTSLQTLYLENNAISIIEIGAFKNSFKDGKIYLQNNYLKIINFVVPNIIVLSIENNPLQCDCAMNVVIEHQISIQGHCLEPKHLKNKTINELSVKDLLCTPKLNCSQQSHVLDKKILLLTCKIHANPTATITWTDNEANISLNAYTEKKEEVILSTLTISDSNCTNAGYTMKVNNAAEHVYHKFGIDCNTLKKSDAAGILLLSIFFVVISAGIIGTIMYVNKPNKCIRRQQNFVSDSNEKLPIRLKETTGGSHDNESTTVDIEEPWHRD